MTELQNNKTLFYKDVVMRQTDYSDDQALEKLKEHNNDIIAIVREYMGIGITKNKDHNYEKKSVNQQIYTEIRSIMDTASASYKLKKEKEELQQQRQQHFIEQARKELERRNTLDEQAKSIAEMKTT